MKSNELWDTAIWLVNILLALGIMAFSFLFILFPSPLSEGTVDPVKIVEDAEGGAAPPETQKRDIEWYGPTWKTKLTQPEPPKPVPNIVTPDKVYVCRGLLMGKIVLEDRQGNQKAYGVGESTPEGFKIVEITNDNGGSARLEYKDGAGQTASQWLRTNQPEAGAPAGPAPGGGKAAGAGGAPGPQPGGAAPAGGAPAGAGAGPAPDGVGVTVDEKDPNHLLVTAAERDYALANANQLIEQVTMRPYIPEGGQMQGMVIEEIAADSRVQRYGLKAKDIVKKVNGVAIDSTKKLPELIQDENLRKAPVIDLEIERAGRMIVLHAEIR